MKEGLVRISYETGDNISLRKMVLTKNVLFLLSYVGIFPIIYVFISWCLVSTLCLKLVEGVGFEPT